MTGNELDILLTALTTGAAAGFKDTATTAIKDAYDACKALLRDKIVSKPKAEAILAEYEADPNTYEKPLKKLLLEEHLDQDQEIITAAKQVLTLAQQQVATGQFTINNQGGHIQAFNQGIFNGSITQNFGEILKDK